MEQIHFCIRKMKSVHCSYPFRFFVLYNLKIVKKKVYHLKSNLDIVNFTKQLSGTSLLREMCLKVNTLEFYPLTDYFRFY